MRVYVKKENPIFSYPDDMKRILGYLEANGTLMVSDKTVEDFYYEFSDSKYSAGWMSVNDDRLKEFADWLAEKEM